MARDMPGHRWPAKDHEWDGSDIEDSDTEVENDDDESEEEPEDVPRTPKKKGAKAKKKEPAEESPKGWTRRTEPLPDDTELPEDGGRAQRAAQQPDKKGTYTKEGTYAGYRKKWWDQLLMPASLWDKDEAIR